MTKTATSIFKAMGAAIERSRRQNKAFDALDKAGRGTDGRAFNIATKAVLKQSGKRTQAMADGKLAKKFSGVVKSVKKKLSVGDFFNHNKASSTSVAMA